METVEDTQAKLRKAKATLANAIEALKTRVELLNFQASMFPGAEGAGSDQTRELEKKITDAKATLNKLTDEIAQWTATAAGGRRRSKTRKGGRKGKRGTRRR
jgi:phage shock protein A